MNMNELSTTSEKKDNVLVHLPPTPPTTIIVSKEDNRRILRRIDLHILPILWIIYGLQYLGMTTLSYASIMGMRTETNMNENQYAWLGSIFYVGYLFFAYPTSRLLQRLPLAKYTAVNLIISGVVHACTSACTNWTSLMVIRFFLGCTRSTITPAFTLVTSHYYRKHEQGTRTGIWFSSNGFAFLFGGLTVYGLSKVDDRHALTMSAWRITFIFTGLVTSVMGFVLFFFLPDTPLNAWFLSEEDRVLAVERLRENNQSMVNRHFKWYQMKEALQDPFVWLYALFSLIGSIPNGGLTNFFSMLISSFGYDKSTTLLYGTPAGAIQIIVILLFLHLGDRFKQRALFSSISTMITLVGYVLMFALPKEEKVSRLLGYYLTAAAPTGYVAILSFISTNVAGYTKKTTVAAMNLIAFCIGNLIGPLTFRKADAPKYMPAILTMILCGVVSILILWLLPILFALENRKRDYHRRDKVAQTTGTSTESPCLDLTDRENLSFLYVY